MSRYASLAAGYDRRWRVYIERSTAATLAHLPVRPGWRVLDVGCGTGVLLGQIARQEPGALLAGVDSAPRMLAVARARLPAGVDLRAGWAEWLPWEDAVFDRVVACNMFHHVRSPVAAMAEMSRVLAPQGELVMTDWCGDYLLSRLRERWRRRIDREHFKTWTCAQWRELCELAGLGGARVERYRIGLWWGLMTVRAVKPANRARS